MNVQEGLQMEANGILKKGSWVPKLHGFSAEKIEYQLLPQENQACLITKLAKQILRAQHINRFRTC